VWYPCLCTSACSCCCNAIAATAPPLVLPLLVLLLCLVLTPCTLLSPPLSTTANYCYLQQIIRLEDSTKGLDKGDDVLAVFPDTTSFYKARVHKVHRIGAGSNYPSNSYGNDGGSSGSERGHGKKDQPLEVSHHSVLTAFVQRLLFNGFCSTAFVQRLSNGCPMDNTVFCCRSCACCA
jgi:SGF29 tudor-like domain